MARRALGAWVIVIAAAIVTPPEMCPARGTVPTLLYSSAASRDTPAKRFYFALPEGDEERLVSIFHALDAAGARRIHAMLPDLIVCHVPIDVDPHSIVRGGGVVIAGADEVTQLTRYDLQADPVAIEKDYARRERGDFTIVGSALPHPAGNYECGLRKIPAHEIYRSARHARVDASGGPVPNDTRLIHQCSEMLIGSIVVNIVLPESAYPYTWWENWSPESIEQVHWGFRLAFDRFMDEFLNADINVIYKYYDQVEIGTEPIYETPEEDKFWITLCLNRLGYVGTEADALQNVHVLNDDTRRRYGADWAFTAFIALAEKKWDGPTFRGARSVSWGYLGGPYYVSSYPASKFTEAEGVAQIARHEIGHIFWGLEEDIGTVAECTDSSGYINAVHGNKVTEYSPVDDTRKGCEGIHPVPCVMNEHDQILIGWDPGTCTYTARMWGVSDLNENEVPDALDRPPVIEFYSADVETVVTPVKQLRVRVVSRAVPNANSQQPVELRRDYAAKIKDINVAVGGLQPFTLLPSDIGSDGYEAEFVVNLPEMIPGALYTHVGARNVYDAVSPKRTKTYRYVHLLYTGFEVQHPNEGIVLTWRMVGELFDAHFVMHRRNVLTGRESVVAEGFTPDVPTVEGITGYQVIDRSTEPGVEYDYWVSGTIDLPYRDTTIHKTVESFHVSTNGAVARTRAPKSLISNLAPNPFSTTTWLSVEIPREPSAAPGGAGSARDDAGVRVNVTVYDVLGRRVNELLESNVIPDVVTISWDGTDDRGRTLPSGLYFMRIEVGPAIKETRKLLLVR